MSYSNSYFETRGVSPKRSGTRDDRDDRSSWGLQLDNSNSRIVQLHERSPIPQVDFGVYSAPPKRILGLNDSISTSVTMAPYFSNNASTSTAYPPPLSPPMDEPLMQPSRHYNEGYSVANSRYNPSAATHRAAPQSYYGHGPGSATYADSGAVEHDNGSQVTVVHHHFYGGKGHNHSDGAQVIHNHLYGTPSTTPRYTAAAQLPTPPPPEPAQAYRLTYGPGREAAADTMTGHGGLFIAGKSQYNTSYATAERPPTAALYPQNYSSNQHAYNQPTYTQGDFASSYNTPSPPPPINAGVESYVSAQLSHNRRLINDQFNYSMEVMQRELHASHVRGLLVVVQEDEAKIRNTILSEENRELAKLADYYNTLSEVIHTYQVQHRNHLQQIEDEIDSNAEEVLRQHYSKLYHGERHRQQVVEDIAKDRDVLRSSQSRTPQRRREASSAALIRQQELTFRERGQIRQPQYQEDFPARQAMTPTAAQQSILKSTRSPSSHSLRQAKSVQYASTSSHTEDAFADHLSPFQARARLANESARPSSTGASKSRDDILDYRPASAQRRREYWEASPGRTVRFAQHM